MFRSSARSRRRWSVVIKVGIGFVLAVIVAVILLVKLQDERIHRYGIDIVAREDGSALVRETIDYEFGTEAKHGIFREIPENQTTGVQSVVSDITVRSASAPSDTVITHGTNAIEIRIGDPDRRVTGRHRYIIEYRLSNVIKDGRLALNVIGSSWRVPIDDVAVKITAPYFLDKVECNQGRVSSTTQCDRSNVDGNKVTAYADGLDESEGMTIYATPGEALQNARTQLPDNVDLRAGSDHYWWARVMALVLAVGTVGYVIGLIPATRWSRRVGRDIAWHGPGGAVDAVFGGPGLSTSVVDDVVADQQTTIQFVPPRDLTPAQGGLLLREEVTDDHRVAWLLQHAMDGWFKIENSGKMLRWTAPDSRWASAPVPLQHIFTSRRDVSLAAYDQQFAKGWKLIEKDLSYWQQTCGLWDRAAEKRSEATAMKLIGIGALAAIVAGCSLVLTADSLPWIGAIFGGIAAVFVGAGVATAVHLGELAVRTPAGFARRQLVEGFRRFFEISEGRHAREAAARGELRLYSAWAVALGELDHWNAAMKAAALPPTTVGVSDIGSIATFSAATQLASTTQSSSSSSSSSSAGVGGGSGGGGGGSW